MGVSRLTGVIVTRNCWSAFKWLCAHGRATSGLIRQIGNSTTIVREVRLMLRKIRI